MVLDAIAEQYDWLVEECNVQIERLREEQRRKT
jgi:hypothetical protein